MARRTAGNLGTIPKRGARRTPPDPSRPCCSGYLRLPWSSQLAPFAQLAPPIASSPVGAHATKLDILPNLAPQLGSNEVVKHLHMERDVDILTHIDHVNRRPLPLRAANMLDALLADNIRHGPPNRDKPLDNLDTFHAVTGETLSRPTRITRPLGRPRIQGVLGLLDSRLNLPALKDQPELINPLKRVTLRILCHDDVNKLVQLAAGQPLLRPTHLLDGLVRDSQDLRVADLESRLQPCLDSVGV